MVITYNGSQQPACCLQLAEQSIEDFMAKRGFHAMPEHEDIWAVPVSQVPAACNLHAQMQAAADRAQAGIDEEAESSVGKLDERPTSPRSRKPQKAKPQVPTCFICNACQICQHACVVRDPVTMHHACLILKSALLGTAAYTPNVCTCCTNRYLHE